MTQPGIQGHDDSIRGCLLAGPGRGDCEHFVGLPEEENEKTTDEYGRPHGWCEVCWRGEQITRLRSELYNNSCNYGGREYAQSVVSQAINNKKAGKNPPALHTDKTIIRKTGQPSRWVNDHLLHPPSPPEPHSSKAGQNPPAPVDQRPPPPPPPPEPHSSKGRKNIVKYARLKLSYEKLGRMLGFPDNIHIMTVTPEPHADNKVIFLLEGDSLDEIPEECQVPIISLSALID